MKQADIKGLSTKELQEKFTEETATYTKLQLSHAVSPIENPMKIRTTRKTIARLATELRTRELAENKQ